MKCYLRVGEIQVAERNLEIAISLEPQNDFFLTLQKEMTILKNEFAEAEKSFSKKEYNEVIFVLFSFSIIL